MNQNGHNPPDPLDRINQDFQNLGSLDPQELLKFVLLNQLRLQAQVDASVGLQKRILMNQEGISEEEAEALRVGLYLASFDQLLLGHKLDLIGLDQKNKEKGGEG